MSMAMAEDYRARGGLAELSSHALGEKSELRVELGAVGGEELADQVLDAAFAQLGELVHQCRRLARQHPTRMCRLRRRLSLGENPHIVAERDGRRYRAAARR